MMTVVVGWEEIATVEVKVFTAVAVEDLIIDSSAVLSAAA